MRTIKVTQNHIDNGLTCSRFCCPVALALKDAGYCDPIVGSFSFSYNNRCSRLVTGEKFPESVSDFIRHFDGGVEVKPFEFKLP